MDFKSQIKSTVTTGTAPLNIASTTVVANLNADLLDGNHASAFLTTSGNAASATKLQTARSISLNTGAVGTATNFDGTANISIPVTGISEAYLTWGGKNLSGTYAPIDAAMVPVLGANRFAFTNPAAVIVEYSRDNGVTWIDYGTSDANKINLLCGNSGNIQVGGGGYAAGTDYTEYQVRLTINTSVGSIYTVLNKFVIYLSTYGSIGAWCTIDARLQSNYTGGIDTWTTFADKVSVGGWPGYNVINTSGIVTYGNSPASQYGQVRFTFGQTGYNVSYTGLQVMKILGFGGVGWVTPSTLAATGLIYTYDYNKNVTFPASVTSTGFVTTIADTTATASHYYVETSSDGVIRPKTLANVKTEIVTKAAIETSLTGTIITHNHNATNIIIADAGNYYTSTNIEDVLQEIGPLLGADISTKIDKSVLVAEGDIIYASAASTPARLAKGTAGQYLKMNAGATAPEWGSIAMPTGLTADPNSTATGFINYNGITATAGQWDGGSTAPSGTIRLNYGGYLYATRVYNAYYNDYAEFFEKGEELEPGDVISKKKGETKYIKSTHSYDNMVVGVYSDSYGHCLGGTGADSEENFIPVGLAGRVDVKVCGKIEEGDLLVASFYQGVAMKADKYIPGTVIGKALENHNSTDFGKIKMLIMNI